MVHVKSGFGPAMLHYFSSVVLLLVFSAAFAVTTISNRPNPRSPPETSQKPNVTTIKSLLSASGNSGIFPPLNPILARQPVSWMKL